MLISYQWLKQYVDLPNSLTPEELALKLTMSTVEVERVERMGENLENIVVGKILKIEKHPDADKLKICKVDIGNVGANSRSPVQCVCGGSNVKEGMLVAFAKVGAKVRWHGEGKLVELKSTKIRGIDSFGMICASTEIGLGEMFPLKDEKEILDLTDHPLTPPSKGGDKAVVGSSLSVVLGLNDVIFEIDNKSMTHRPDLWGHYGMAREIAALYNKKLADYKTKEIKKLGNKEIKLTVKVEDKKLCPRYMAVAIEGIKIGPSPKWMQKLLSAVGLRPINNIVDITNYLLLDLGQPMHAFDANYLNQKSKISAQGGSASGGKNLKSIVIRRARDGEKFKTLDGQEYKLTKEMLVIADEQRAIALAGVMGGENSEINDNTATIIYESATFDATNIRKTALKLGLRTESSARFEKLLDPNNAELALRRAVQLTLEMCPDAKVASQVADEKNFHLNQGPIELSPEFLRKKIGKEISKKEVVSILERLGFKVKDKKGRWSVLVPSWRATKDISIPEDLVEEVARIYGYGNIEPKLPVFPIIPPEKNELRQLERKIKNLLALEFGFNEACNYSFVSPELLKKLEMDQADFIELENPVAKDRPYLRRNIWPGLLENVEKNLHQFDSVKLFEIGKVFRKDKAGQRAKENSDELLPEQDLILSLTFSSKGAAEPFYEVAEALAGLFGRLNLSYEFSAQGGSPPKADGPRAHVSGGKMPERNKNEKIVHSGRGALVEVAGKSVGAVGELRSLAAEKLGIDERVAVGEIDLNLLLPLLTEKKIYHPSPPYPAVKRDLAFMIDKRQEYEKIIKIMKSLDPLIAQVELFDIYTGQGIAPDKKSLAFHISYQSAERTLTAEEVEAVHQKLIKKLGEMGAEVRGM